jgi:aerobic-type carbon monoxide dehydrogenase small subunit (CoxS/CutS family)
VRLRVNGAVKEVDAAADAVLLWVLRDDFGCSSAKYGCGLEQCGACRVLVDGIPVASCQLAVGDVGDHEVTTLEGLRDTDAGRRVVDALIARNAGQCAYCVPGIAVTLIELASRGATVDRAALLRALDDHLCRCGSQPRILRAAVDALGIDS